MDLDQSILETSVNLDGNISENRTLIKVIGVGGAGTNAVNHMYEQGIANVDFVICNTDLQSLRNSPIPNKIQLGKDGLGAGNKPEKGREAAENTIEAVTEMLKNDTEMVFITAGMGGGTGTGAAPVIARLAKEMGILTIGIVEIPFKFEGKPRLLQAMEGVKEMSAVTDSLIVVSTDKIRDIWRECKISDAFDHANDVMLMAAKGIAELITVHGKVNVDLNDVRTAMTDSGNAVMGFSMPHTGRGRAVDAIAEALDSPLLLSSNLKGARSLIFNISCGKNELTIEELETISDFIEDKIQNDDNCEVIWGYTIDEKNLGEDDLRVLVVATGFPIDCIDNLLNMKSKKASEAPKSNVTSSRPVEQPRPASQPVFNVVEKPAEPTYRPSEPTRPTEPRTSTSNYSYSQRTSPAAAVTEPNPDDMLNAIYGGKKKANGKPESNTAVASSGMPTELVNFEDDDEGHADTLSNFNFSGEEASAYSVKQGDDLEMDDNNGFLHNNVD